MSDKAGKKSNKRGPGRPKGSKNKTSRTSASASGRASSGGAANSAPMSDMDKKREEIRLMRDKRHSEKNVYDVIWGIVIAALGALIIAAVQFNAAGEYGNKFGMILKGIFGIVGVLLPWYLILIGVLLIAHMALHFSKKTLIVSLFMFLALCSLNSGRFISENYINYNVVKFYAEGQTLKGGGVLGMTIGSFLVSTIGKSGLYIVSLAGLLICLLLLVKTPLSSWMEKNSDKREEKRLLREEEERIRKQAAIAEMHDRAEELNRAQLTYTPEVVPESKPAAKAVSDADDDKKGAFSRFFSSSSKENDPSSVPVPESMRVGKAGKAGAAGSDDSDSLYFDGKGRSAKPGKNHSNIVRFYDQHGLIKEGAEESDGSLGLEEGSKPVPGYGMDDPDWGSEAQTDKNELGVKKTAGADGDQHDDTAGDAFYDNEDKPAKKKKKRGFKIFGYGDDSDDAVSTGRAANAGASAAGAGLGAAEAGAASIAAAGAASATGGVGSPAASMGAEAAGASTDNASTAKDDKVPDGRAALTGAELAATANELNDNINKPVVSNYKKPPVDLLNPPQKIDNTGVNEELRRKAAKLEETLQSFNVKAHVVQVTQGPAVTRYEIQPEVGVKVANIVRLSDDIALNLRAKSIRIEAPIPGKAAVGIEVDNDKVNMVTLREIIDSREFRNAKSKVSFAVGKDIAGNNIVGDISSMPHLLIAGSTGSGKSVCINSIIMSILYKADPNEVKLMLIDPKVVELSIYNGIPHLMIPVVTDPGKAAAALNWAVVHMQERYKKFAEAGARDIKSYNKKMKAEGRPQEVMPQIVIIIDELADLMMAAPKQVQDSICRLAQLARAAGMHLIVATQRPSVDVITGVIKANIASRIAFAVSSQVDSRTILDKSGAEHLVGKGDMLFAPLGSIPLRVQGAFVSDEEVARVINFVKDQQQDINYSQDVIDRIESGAVSEAQDADDDVDELFDEAVDCVVKAGQASTSMLQRRFRIGYNRAARIVDEMEERGVIGPQDGSRPRKVLISEAELERSRGGAPAPEETDDTYEEE